MPIDPAGLLEQRRADKFQLSDRHLNGQLARVLRTLGCAVDYVRAMGPHLFDAEGNRYLDLLSIRIPFDDLDALERALAGRAVAAFVVEPIQGKGINLPSDGYLPAAAQLCRAHGTLLVADEIQTGMGRTGRFLDGSTFAKNDLAMAAGLATLTGLEDEHLIARAAELGTRLAEGLRRSLAPFDMVKAVRGKGMMLALELGPPRDLRLKAVYALMDRASKGLFCQLVLIQLLRRHRILAQVAGHDLPMIKLLPPLVLSEQDLDWILRGFTSVIGDSQSLASLARLGRTLAGHALRARRRRVVTGQLRLQRVHFSSAPEPAKRAQGHNTSPRSDRCCWGSGRTRRTGGVGVRGVLGVPGVAGVPGVMGVGGVAGVRGVPGVVGTPRLHASTSPAHVTVI